MCDHDPSPLSQFVRDLVRRKVQQLVGKAGIQAQDQEDLTQELYLHLLKRADAFDRGKAHEHVFAAVAIDRYLLNLLRQRQAAKRHPERQRPLDEPSQVPGATTEPLATERELDIEDALASLPDDLRDLAEQLMSHTKADIARAQDVPRTTLYWKIGKLRRHFEERGLKDYLPQKKSSRQRPTG